MQKYYVWDDNVFLGSPDLSPEEEKVKKDFLRYTKAIKVNL
jgi:hypothetical protein